MREFLLEIVVTSLLEIAAAREGGADRLEVCADIELGGLTPAPDLLQAACEHLPAVAMLRPHARSFFYDARDRETIFCDLEWLSRTRAEGVVFGALTPEGRIDRDLLRRVVSAGKPVVFHRAFDEVHDRAEALEELIELGVKRVLTSGGKGDALANLDTLQRTREQAAGRIEVLPGGGVRPHNVEGILSRLKTEAIHAAPFRTGEVSAESVRAFRGR